MRDRRFGYVCSFLMWPGLACAQSAGTPATAPPQQAATPAATAAPPDAANVAVTDPQAAASEEQKARSTAVALNYCRASFHRLRQNPSKRVWFEEQQHILNNLNLNEIGDQEVITLYTNVLEEIGKERIADKERVVLRQSYKNQIRRQVLSNAFVLGAELTTAQYVNAVRTGANGWWDYRTTTTNRDMDLWRVEKTRMNEVVDKSSKFLDTFWKMAQKRHIQDHWLVRGDDLDRLDAALTEQNIETRLRVLQRMERFMTCYPPYHYHVARTQQALGQWAESVATYEKLATLGHGHFRKDEMLAAGLANQAVIQAYLKQPDAVKTARRALEYSTGVWQANLVCARILQQQGTPDEAEEAILRNLDVDLERPQSLACLVSLYQHSGEDAKLIATLSQPENLTELPALSLLQSVATLGPRKMPPLAMQQLVTSLYAYDQSAFGRQQLVMVASPTWSLERADATLVGIRPETPETRGISSRGQTQLVFSANAMQVNAQGEPELVMEVRYPESQPIRLHLRRTTWSQDMLDHVENQVGRGGEVRGLLPIFSATRRRDSFMVSEVEVGQRKVALWDRNESTDPTQQQLLVDQQKPKGPGQLHGAAKASQVTIESVTPLGNPVRPKTPSDLDDIQHAPAAPKDTRPATKPAQPKAKDPAERPLPSIIRGPVQLGEDIEELETEPGDEFQ